MNRLATLVLTAMAATTLAAGAGADQRHDDRGDPRQRDPREYGGGRLSEPRPNGGYSDPRAFRGPPSVSYGGPPPTPQRRANSLGADWREQQEEARSGVRQGQMAPLGSVIQDIGRHAAGRPLDAGIEYQGSRAVYRVRWLRNDGRRVDYIVDAASGAIVGEH